MAAESAEPEAVAAGRRRAVARMKAKEAAVGAVARVLFYPTLLYNVVRSKVQAEFRWWDEVDQFIWLGAVPFRRDVPRLQKLGVVQEFSKRNAELPSVTTYSAGESLAGDTVLVTEEDLEGSDVTEVITEKASLSSHKISLSRPMIKMLSCLFPSLKESSDSSVTEHRVSEVHAC